MFGKPFNHNYNEFSFQKTFNPVFGSAPKKSILKKTNSVTIHKGSAPYLSASPTATPYSTVTGAESRLRSAFDSLFR